MAIRISNKFPLDLDTRTGIGVSLPLNGSAVFNLTYQTKDQIKSNLINFLLTNNNERIFNPNLGVNLRDILFENISNQNLDSLIEVLKLKINKYFPMIEIVDFKFITLPDENTINFNLSYRIANFGITDQLNIQLQ